LAETAGNTRGWEGGRQRNGGRGYGTVVKRIQANHCTLPSCAAIPASGLLTACLHSTGKQKLV